MITNYGRLVDALTHLSDYYNKIILVDIAEDSFEVCKISSDEWDHMDTNKLSEWINEFINSDLLHEYDKESFTGYMKAFLDGCFVRPATTYYQKKIDDNWHTVFMECIPIQDNKYYILVKDFTLMEG